MTHPMQEVACSHCAALFMKRVAEVRYHEKAGRGRFYCSRKCSGLSRRKKQTPEEKKAKKAEYDRKRRNGPKREQLLAEKRANYYRNHEYYLTKQAEARARPGYSEAMREYGRKYRDTERWKEHKRQYDREYRAKKAYGPWWESAVALWELRDAINEKMSRTEVYTTNGTINKAQTRKRKWQRTL